MPKKKNPLIPSFSWKNEFAVDAYILAKSGSSDTDIAAVWGIHQQLMAGLRRKYPLLGYALEKARIKPRDFRAKETMEDFILGRLPPDVREVWEKLQLCVNHPNGIQRVQALTANMGKEGRQQLLVHAILNSRFSVMEACRLTGVSYGTYNMWLENDPDFVKLFDQIEVCKKEFFQDAFVKKVEEGDTNCTVHGARTVARSLGYGDRIEVKSESTVTHQHLHSFIPVDELELDVDTKRKLLTAMQKREERMKALKATPLQELEHKGIPTVVEVK